MTRAEVLLRRQWPWQIFVQGFVSMGDTADTLKPVPVRRRSAARLAAVQMSYQGQMSGQSVAEFLPVFLQHYSEDIRKPFWLRILTAGISTNWRHPSSPAASSWINCWQVASRPGGRSTG